MNSRMEVFNFLQRPPRGMLLRNIQLNFRDRSAEVVFVYDPDDPEEITLLLSKCSSFHTDVIINDSSIEDGQELEDVVAVLMGDRTQNHPLRITTLQSETAIVCEQIEIKGNSKIQ